MTVAAVGPEAALAAMLTAAAVWLLLPRRGRRHALPAVLAERTVPRRAPGERHGAARRATAAAVLAGVAPAVFLGGALGVVAGLVVAVLVHRVVAAREPPALRRRREAVGRDLPHVVDLLGVALAAGAAPTAALAVVGEAVAGPIAEELLVARRGLALGRDPAQVWRELGHRPGLASLGRTMARAVETGASVSDALHRLADDLQAVSRLEAEIRARTVGVRAAAPLGLCLLPAFVLVGVMPLVAGTARALLGH